MKIYTVTFLINNYGSLLQAYALQSRLKEFGVEPFIIVKTPLQRKRTILSLLSVLKPEKNYNLFQRIKKRVDAKKYHDKNVKLNRFIKDHLAVIKIDDTDDFLNSVSSEDVFLAGSDQIWNVLNQPLSKWYSLQWTEGRGFKNYSYAASIGLSVLSLSQQQDYENGLSSFRTISLRERQAVDLISPIFPGKVRQDIDPTLLWDVSFWRKKESLRIVQEPYVFVYMLRPDRNVIKLAQKVAKERQCKIVYTGLFFYKSPNLKTVCDAGIEDFLSYIDYAEVVVTNSFHGTVFSVLYEKRFLSVKIASTSSRVDSFLEMTGLKTQSVESANDNYSLDNIDFAKAKEVLEIERRKSLDYLQSICNSKS